MEKIRKRQRFLDMPRKKTWKVSQARQDVLRRQAQVGHSDSQLIAADSEGVSHISDGGLAHPHKPSDAHQHSNKRNKVERGKNKQQKNWCVECSVQFASKYLFQKHNMTSHNIKSAYTCEFCSKQFIKKSHWHEHVSAVHCNDRNFLCPLCEHTYKTARALKRHQKESHRFMTTELQDDNEQNTDTPSVLTNKSLTCSECQQEFPSHAKLLQHNMKQHIKSFKHMCDSCGKRFLRKSHLLEHVRTVHCETRDFHCTLCDIKYKSARGLKRHEKESHRVVCTEIKDENNETRVSMTVVKIKKGSLTCSECLKDFPSRAELLQHNAEQHSESYKHLCDTCGKRFLRRTHLKDHVASVHIYGAEIHCQLCGKSYKAMSSLRRHLRDSHGGRKNELSMFDLLRNSGVMGTWHLRKKTSSMYASVEVDSSDDDEDSESYKGSDEEDIDEDVSLPEEEDESDQERDEEDFEDDSKTDSESDEEDMNDSDDSLSKEEVQSDEESELDTEDREVFIKGKRYDDKNRFSVDTQDDKIQVTEENGKSDEDSAIVTTIQDDVKTNDKDTLSDAGIRLVDNHKNENEVSKHSIIGETIEQANTKMSLSVDDSNSSQQDASLSKESGDDTNEEDNESSFTSYTCRWEPLQL
ncbi:transcription factor hamlet-like isoform X2 [Dreissena polymorpha]|uniref:transcription factor hamlet-like isoform X2 n=1 Tax=Dreissena polymorpha TaxID=45954 RepID=UPI0022648629|nr:transcription factor hamlet-like isoform X2 [Dreissena polymorpha]XP_052212796.1 transcription factor hamlet-like isoform X2 [Dreissena polymorpha]XP_052212797.1 transcription factor hamlet-like isoform X2 [Dreissena polymorpha]